jgi:hypothetical protein
MSIMHKRNPKLLCVTHDDLAFAFLAIADYCQTGVELSDHGECQLEAILVVDEILLGQVAACGDATEVDELLVHESGYKETYQKEISDA